jgi:LmbE family N-acetylglucosaminyl deacetylase
MTQKILFVVAHPDDESLWIGGILNFLADREEVDVYVICATGKYHEHRSKEFESALNIAGINNRLLSPQDIPTSHAEALVDLNNSISTGIKQMGLCLEDIDIIITHPFYGDEHQHPNHKQLFSYLRDFCTNNGIPFGFFSTFVLPNIKLNPLQRGMKRHKKTHVINYCSCDDSIIKHFMQFKIDPEKKDGMLKCYQSINQEEHQRGYASWDSCVEGIYFTDDKGVTVFDNIYNNLEIPADSNIF